MKSFTLLNMSIAALVLSVGTALAQHKDDPHPPGPAPQSKPHGEPVAATKVADPYPFDNCPVTGEKLGSMGDPVVKVYDSREVRFCCPSCPGKFEKDKVASLAKLDERIIKDQAPLYPTKTSIMTGKDLPAKPFNFVYRNRLVQFGAENEKAGFLKDPAKYLAALNNSVIEQQGKHYPLAKCPVSGEKYGDMGKPVDVVLAGRLIRLCCKDCKKEIEKDPAKFIAKVDAARKGDKENGKTDHGHN